MFFFKLLRGIFNNGVWFFIIIIINWFLLHHDQVGFAFCSLDLLLLGCFMIAAKIFMLYKGGKIWPKKNKNRAVLLLSNLS